MFTALFLSSCITDVWGIRRVLPKWKRLSSAADWTNGYGELLLEHPRPDFALHCGWVWSAEESQHDESYWD